jgi:hypothetical protein
MVDLFPYLVIRGEHFSPRQAEELTCLTLSNKLELGEIATRGRYKGKPRPFGAAHIKVSKDVASTDRLSRLLELVAPHLESLQQLGATSRHVHIDVCYWDQCNLEFEPEEIARIAVLALPLTISCYNYSGRPEPAEPNATPGRGGNP